MLVINDSSRTINFKIYVLVNVSSTRRRFRIFISGRLSLRLYGEGGIEVFELDPTSERALEGASEYPYAIVYR